MLNHLSLDPGVGTKSQGGRTAERASFSNLKDAHLRDHGTGTHASYRDAEYGGRGGNIALPTTNGQGMDTCIGRAIFAL